MASYVRQSVNNVNAKLIKMGNNMPRKRVVMRVKRGTKIIIDKSFADHVVIEVDGRKYEFGKKSD